MCSTAHGWSCTLSAQLNILRCYRLPHSLQVDMSPSFVGFFFFWVGGVLFFFLSTILNVIFFPLLTFFFSSNCIRNDPKLAKMQNCANSAHGIYLHSASTFWIFRICFHAWAVAQWHSAQHPVEKGWLICSVLVVSVFVPAMPENQLRTLPTLFAVVQYSVFGLYISLLVDLVTFLKRLICFWTIGINMWKVM